MQPWPFDRNPRVHRSLRTQHLARRGSADASAEWRRPRLGRTIPAMRVRPSLVVALALTGGAVALLLGPLPIDPNRVLDHGDKWAHATMFALLATAWRLAGTRRRWLVVGGVALAAGSEVLQGVMALGRAADALDAVADLVGVALVVAAITVGKRLWPAEEETPPAAG